MRRRGGDPDRFSNRLHIAADQPQIAPEFLPTQQRHEIALYGFVKAEAVNGCGSQHLQKRAHIRDLSSTGIFKVQAIIVPVSNSH